MAEFTGVPLVLTAGIFYNSPDNPRFEQSLAFAEACSDNNLPAVFVDASPMKSEGDTWVADAHRERGGIVLRAEVAGIATQRKQGVAYAIAGGAIRVVGTESEKVEIPDFADEMADALDGTDILVVGRTQEAEDSLPPTQQLTERLAGWILQETHFLPHDALAGPRGFSVAGARVLADYPANKDGMNNWIYMYDTPVEARRRGLRVGGLDLGFIYPTELVEDETGDSMFDKKRYDQFEMQLRHLLPAVRDNAHAPTYSRDIARATLTLLDMESFKDGDNVQKGKLLNALGGAFMGAKELPNKYSFAERLLSPNSNSIEFTLDDLLQ